MMDQFSFLMRLARHIVVLAILVGLMSVAGMDWAHAAAPQANTGAPGALPVVALFLATIAFVIRAVTQSQKPARARARRRNRR